MVSSHSRVLFIEDSLGSAQRQLTHCTRRDMLIFALILLATLPLFPGNSARSISSPQEVRWLAALLPGPLRR